MRCFDNKATFKLSEQTSLLQFRSTSTQWKQLLHDHLSQAQLLALVDPRFEASD
eukprot:m.277400 g.277400  ORF g.277400 m.277400 type:complete len:54 (-) comp15727_c0_seq1:2534-2695(-)